MQTKTTYRAVQVKAPGELELVEREIPQPSAGEILIAVEACGICGADRGDIERADPQPQPPRVPGHEVVGRIAALGAGVPDDWTLGQRVGVGRLGGHCNRCIQCRQGRFQLCLDQPIVGASCDGGYAEMMIVRSTGVVAIPDELDAEDAAPILCAGVATFNALRKCGAGPGDTVAVFGIGGLGHMAVQYAHRMGFRVVAVGRGHDLEDQAKRLGAHVYIDGAAQDAAEALKGMGGAAAIVATVVDANAVSAISAGLAPGGTLLVLGVGKEPLSISPRLLVGGERSIAGSVTGTPYETERALDFSVLAGVRPWAETMPLKDAGAAYRRMLSGAVTFRMVLVMGGED